MFRVPKCSVYLLMVLLFRNWKFFFRVKKINLCAYRICMWVQMLRVLWCVWGGHETAPMGGLCPMLCLRQGLLLLTHASLDFFPPCLSPVMLEAHWDYGCKVQPKTPKNVLTVWQQAPLSHFSGWVQRHAPLCHPALTFCSFGFLLAVLWNSTGSSLPVLSLSFSVQPMVWLLGLCSSIPCSSFSFLIFVLSFLIIIWCFISCIFCCCWVRLHSWKAHHFKCSV